MGEEDKKTQNIVQDFGDIEAAIQGEESSFTITNTQIIKVSPDEVQTRELIESSPYKGLRRFEVEDRDLFFGREQLVASLLEVVSRSDLLLLLGASGSGKSSVIRAGLIPQLRERLGAKFRNFTFTPDRDPFESLRISLVSEGYKQSEAEVALAGESDILSQVIGKLKEEDSQWLFFIDQFEELFTLCQDLEKREKFIDSLVQVAESGEKSVKVVLALRADFPDQFNPYPALAKIAQGNIRFVTDMHPDELRLAIEQPAANHGVVFEEGLVEEIIDDVRGQAGSLPLLQYTLDLLWHSDDISDRILNVKTYRQLGGVRGALQRHVDEIYRDLSNSEQEAAKKIFLRLVDITGSQQELNVIGRTITRRASVSEFGGETVERVLDRLINQNLLVSDRPSREEMETLHEDVPEPTVEIAHETLIHSWERLQEWIEESREVIKIRNRLNEDAKRWQEALDDVKIDPKDELWSGSKLQRVVELRESGEFDRLGGLSEREKEFVDASVEWRESQHQRELRRNRRIAIGASCVAVVMAGLVGLVGYEWRKAEIRQINASIASVEAHLRSNQGMEALLDSLRAVERLKHSFLKVFEPDIGLKHRLRGTLHKAVYQAKERYRLKGHSSAVNSVSYSPNGQYLATASRDSTAKIWDTQGNRIATLNGHLNSVNSASFSPDNQYLATASADGTAKVWDIQGNLIFTFTGHLDGVVSVSFSPDGQYLATASEDNTAKVWNIQGKQIATFKHSGEVYSVSFSPNGQYLATASRDETAKVWDIEAGNPVATFTTHSDVVYSVSFSPDGQYLATASFDSTAKVWNVEEDNPIVTLSEHSNSVRSVSFSPDGQYLATASNDRTAKIWNREGNQIVEFEHSAPVYKISFSPDGKYLATASADGTVKVWDIDMTRTPSNLADEFEHSSLPIFGADFSPNGQYLATASIDSTAKVWEIGRVEEDNPMATFTEHSAEVWSVSYSPDGQYLATASEDGTAKVWDIEAGNPIFIFTRHSAPVISISFSPDGQYLATASDDRTAKVWNRETGNIIATFTGHFAPVHSVRFSPDGQYLATASADGTAKVWNIESGNLVATLTGHVDEVINISFSPDGQYLATASADGTAKVWNIQGKQVATTFTKHLLSVHDVSFSPDGQYLATTSYDRTTKVWDIETGKLIAEFEHSAPALSVNFSPDGQYLATTLANGTAKVWRMERFDELLLKACGRVDSYLQNNTNVRKLCKSFHHQSTMD
jgi:WD40 repeat protein